MADDIDRAGDQIEAKDAAAIADIRNRPLELPRTGQCHNCERKFPPGDMRVYCDDECAGEHQHFLKMKGR